MIVKGHCLNYEEIVKDENSFPKNYPVGPEKLVNIQALTVYLRLADILDCYRTRTPLVLFDFLNLQDSISKDEWERHLSILTVSPDDKSENIIITAKTDKPIIFYNIKKFEKLVKQELRSSLEILQFQPDRYGIKYREIILHLSTEGFEPVELLFLVNRNTVLEILMGNNLYSNPSTPIREMLQNSVDACRQRAKLEPEYNPEIKIFLYIKNFEIYIECQDNGVGMTSEIVEKFLLNVGSNYYDSEIYLNSYSKRKRIEPIAKFGIGFLSYFLLGDEILVKTKNEKEEAFSLEFNGIKNYIVKRKMEENFEIGTTVRIKVTRSIDKDFDLIKSVEEFIGLLEIPIFIEDKIKFQNKQLVYDFDDDIDLIKRKIFFVLFNSEDDIGIKGFIAPINHKFDDKNIISQLGFKIPLESVLPDWIKNFVQIIDLSYKSKISLTTSREKVIEGSKLNDIKAYISKKIIKEIYSKLEDKKIKSQYIWSLLRNNIVTKALFLEKEDNLNIFYNSLNISGYINKKYENINLTTLKYNKITLDVLPYWFEDDLKSIRNIYNPEDVFICKAFDINFCKKIHEFLQVSTKSIGIPFWIPEIKMHAWRYKTNNLDFGSYDEKLGDYSSYFPINGWDIDYEVESPTIYYGECESPYLFFYCPFNTDDLFINSEKADHYLTICKNYTFKAFLNDLSNKIDELATDRIFTPDESLGYISYPNTIKIVLGQVINTILNILQKKEISIKEIFEPEIGKHIHFNSFKIE
jgi:hypothetical protein